MTFWIAVVATIIWMIAYPAIGSIYSWLTIGWSGLSKVPLGNWDQLRPTTNRFFLSWYLVSKQLMTRALIVLRFNVFSSRKSVLYFSAFIFPTNIKYITWFTIKNSDKKLHFEARSILEHSIKQLIHQYVLLLDITYVLVRNNILPAYKMYLKYLSV